MSNKQFKGPKFPGKVLKMPSLPKIQGTETGTEGAQRPVAENDRCIGGNFHTFRYMESRFEHMPREKLWLRADVFYCQTCLEQKETRWKHHGPEKPMWFTKKTL